MNKWDVISRVLLALEVGFLLVPISLFSLLALPIILAGLTDITAESAVFIIFALSCYGSLTALFILSYSVIFASANKNILQSKLVWSFVLVGVFISLLSIVASLLSATELYSTLDIVLQNAIVFIK